MFLFAVDSKRKTPKETEVNIKHLKHIWSLHQKVADEHIRSASYLLQYRSYTSSYNARPVASISEPLPASEDSSPDSHIPLSQKMGKRRVPALFEETSSAGDGKRSKVDVPKGTKRMDAAPSLLLRRSPRSPQWLRARSLLQERL